MAMDLYDVLTGVTARLAHDGKQHLVKDFARLWISNHAVVEHVRFQPAVFALISQKKGSCDSLRVWTANADYADSPFSFGRGYRCNRVLFVHGSGFILATPISKAIKTQPEIYAITRPAAAAYG